MTEQLTEPAQDAAMFPAGPVRVSWAPIPMVNLMPLEVLEKRRFRRTRFALAGAVFVSVVLGVLGMLSAQRSVSDANDELAAAQSHVTALQMQAAKYAAVPKVTDELTAATAARTLAMGRDVLWYQYLNDLDGARPAGVQLTGLQATLNAQAAVGSTSAGGGTTNPLASAGLGTVNINAEADQYDEISTWLESISKIVGLSSSALTSASNSGTVAVPNLTFISSAVIDSDALSDRYTKKAG
jgi:hypothetical protein